MKVILEFNRPEEEEELNHALKGSEYHNALFDFYQNSIRKRTKYCEFPEAVHNEIEKIAQEFHDEMSHRGIEL